MKFKVLPFEWDESPHTPELGPGESIKLAVSKVQVQGRRVHVEFHATYMIPDEVADRYADLDSAMVLVLTDVDQRDGFAVKTVNTAYVKYAPGYGPPEINLESPPPHLPLPLRGKAAGDDRSASGADVNGSIWFDTVKPVHSPSVFLYLVFENFVSNTVGLDLVAQTAIGY